jgi:hypothetical protein
LAQLQESEQVLEPVPADERVPLEVKEQVARLGDRERFESGLRLCAFEQLVDGFR